MYSQLIVFNTHFLFQTCGGALPWYEWSTVVMLSTDSQLWPVHCELITNPDWVRLCPSLVHNNVALDHEKLENTKSKTQLR